MKIGITCYPTYGGSGVVATELGIELAKMGHCIHFISYETPFKLNSFYKNVYFHEVEVLEYPLFKYPPYNLSLSVKMAEIAESEKLDLMHVHYAIPHAASAYLAQSMLGKERFKFITTLHGTDITIVGNHSSFYKITKFCIEESDGITCVSNYLKNATNNTFDINKEIKVIYNFVDTNKFKRDKKYIKDLDIIKKDEKAICHISNFRPVKKIKNIIKTFCNISKHVNAKLLLVGDGPELNLARELAIKLGLNEKVIFLGRQDNIIPILNISDLFLLPSKSESFGLAALEALSCEVPVIGTNIGGLKEVITDGFCGYTYDPDDIRSMSDAAIKILSDKDLYKKFARNARKRALDFDCKVIIPQYLDYYKEIISQ
jgi:L-malate glycosyltransferase